MATILQWDPLQDTAIRQFVEPGIDLPCLIPWRFLFIQEHTQKVFACPYHAVPYGDLTKNSLDEIWNSSIAQEMRRALLQKKIPLYCLNNAASCPVIMQQKASGYREAAVDDIEVGRNDFWLLEDGWYRLEYIPDPIRWSSERATFRIDAGAKHRLRLEVLCTRPQLDLSPLTGRICFAGTEVGQFLVDRIEWKALTLDIEERFALPNLSVSICIDNPWVPKQVVEGNGDTRSLGLAVRRAWTL